MTSTLTFWLVQAFDLILDVARGHLEIVDAARAVDAAGDQLRVAGDETEDIDVLQRADVAPLRGDGEAAHPMAASS